MITINMIRLGYMITMPMLSKYIYHEVSFGIVDKGILKERIFPMQSNFLINIAQWFHHSI